MLSKLLIIFIYISFICLFSSLFLSIIFNMIFTTILINIFLKRTNAKKLNYIKIIFLYKNANYLSQFNMDCAPFLSIFMNIFC
jgi:hypothetical protein